MKPSIKTAGCIAGALTVSLAASSALASGVVAPQLRGAVPRFLVKPPSAVVQARLQASLHANPATVVSTIPYWTSTVTSPLDGRSYTYSMVGGSPYAPTPSNTNVPWVGIILRIHVKDSTGKTYIIDPRLTSHCDTQSAATRFFNSPIFQPIASFASNGVEVANTPGGQQLISAYQRANYWSAVHGTNYGVTLTAVHPGQYYVVDWTPTRNSPRALLLNDDCGGAFPIAEVDINELDTELQSVARAHATATQLPVTLVADTAIYQGTYSNCCILGYHNAVPLGVNGVQVYAIGAYFTQKSVFGPHFSDTTVWSHEMAELFDDPFVQSIGTVPSGVNNGLTPAWGHTGQESGCENNLENGDPLTPDQAGNYPNYGITGVGGFTYHFQDLAFHDWFYRTASTSTGGKYSLVGNFISPQAACV